MSSTVKPRSKTRRDFLAQAGSTALLAGLPFLPKPAVAQQSYEAAPDGAAPATFRIYPAIGISRVGGSDQWFYAPEVPGLPPDAGDGFKDGLRKIKKQVQRFRVYAFDDQNRVIGEVTDGDARIDWQVHLANTKAAWYGFNNPLDNDDLAPGLPGKLRNQYFVSDQRREEMLLIDGGVRDILGANRNVDGTDPAFAFEGMFWGEEPVGLGQLRTDAAGRLLVVPPDGVSKSPTNAAITSFADNDEWHDDWCDGPVTAAVTVDGQTFQAEPAWVACVGPNFAPDIPPITSLYDLVEGLNAEQGWSPPPARPLSFRRDLYPTFRGMLLMEWITNAARNRAGWLNDPIFADPDLMAKLANPGENGRPLRERIFGYLRDPDLDAIDAYKTERLKIPYMLGDGVNYDGSPLQWFRFPKPQYEMLRAWAAGDFVDDLEDAGLDAIRAIEDLPVAAQPAALTRAALEPCSGGAFHPGVELTYYLRLPQMYARHYDDRSEPWRIAHGDRDSLLQNVGRLLTPTVAFEGGNGNPPPIGRQMAGDLTRWMGLPWQCDAFSCQQVLMQDNYPTATWWPALLPIDVLPEEYYDEMLRLDLPDDKKVQFYNSRLAWSRGVAGIGYHANGSYWDGITNMITIWERMGFVVKKTWPAGVPRPEGIPEEIYVETGRDDVEFRFDWRPDDGVVPN